MALTRHSSCQYSCAREPYTFNSHTLQFVWQRTLALTLGIALVLGTYPCVPQHMLSVLLTELTHVSICVCILSIDVYLVFGEFLQLFI